MRPSRTISLAERGAAEKQKAFFFEKKKKKLLIILASACPDRLSQLRKSFCFFFSTRSPSLPTA
jgi:hypothetical protein